MSTQPGNYTFTKGDTLVSLWRRLVDGDGDTPRDISGDTITFQMTLESDSSEKIIAGSEAGTVNMKQAGDGVAIITAITAAFPPVVTTSDTHGLTAGDVVTFSGIVGMTELNDLFWEVGAVGSTTTFEVNAIAGGPLYGTQFNAWSSGGIVDTRGMVSYDWAAADVDTAGIYRGQFIRTNTSKTETFPNDSRGFRIEIKDPAKDA